MLQAFYKLNRNSIFEMLIVFAATAMSGTESETVLSVKNAGEGEHKESSSENVEPAVVSDERETSQSIQDRKPENEEDPESNQTKLKPDEKTTSADEIRST